MLRSLYSGVSGLLSHQTKMDVIGNNIANVNTYGFKGSRVTFRDIYYQSMRSPASGSDISGGINPSQVGYGVSVASIDKIMSRSSFQSTSNALDIAIAGEGFIQVSDKIGNKYYTRAGMLDVDNAGNLVDSNGRFVLGTVNADPTNSAGLPINPGSSRINIAVPDAFSNPSYTIRDVDIGGASCQITLSYSAGGSSNPGTITIETDADANGATIDEDGNLVVSIKAGTDIGTPAQLATAINNAIEKGRETPTDDDPNVMCINDDNYKGGLVKISYTIDGTPADMTPEEQNQAIVDAILGADGELTSELKPQTFANLTSFSIGPDGVLTGMHPFHGLLTFGRIDLATFDNPIGLNEAGNSYFTETVASGRAKAAAPGFDGSGELQSSALEMSNVSLAQEFSDMITTQRGFQANSRIITTSDTMLEELINLKR